MAGGSNFVKPIHRRQYKEFVQGIREDLGRDVTLHLNGIKHRCPNCLFDPVNKRSTGMYSPQTPFLVTRDFNGNTVTGPIPFTGGICPVCNGTGNVTEEISKLVLCGIRYLKSEKKQYVQQGIITANDFRLNADIKYLNDFENCRVVEIDGTPADITVINKGGLGDLIKIIVFCKRSDWPPGMKRDVTKY